MTETCRLLEDYMQVYKENVDRVHAMDEMIFQPSVTESEWLSVYNKRSETIRSAYAQNVQNIEAIEKLCAGPLTDEMADTMYWLIFNLDRAKYDDPFYSEQYLTLLYKYYCEDHLYQGPDALEREIFVTQRLGYAYGMMTRLGYPCSEKALACYLKILSLRHLYTKIEDPEYRYFFFAAYYNAINNFHAVGLLDIEETAQLIDEMDEFWRSREVQRLDGDNAKIRHWVLFAKQFWLAYTFENSAAGYSPECIAIYKRLADELWNAERLAHGSDLIRYNAEAVVAHYRSEYLTGSAGFTDALKTILKYYDLRHNYQQTNPKNTEFVYDEEYMFEANIPEILIADWLSNELVDEQFRKEQTRRLIREKNKYVFGLVSRTESVLLNHILSSWDMIILDKLESKQEKEEVLFSNIINRQISTYLHSQMVAILTELYVDAILRTAPELFVGLRGIKTAEEVPARQDELRKFARDCALIHDVGKNKFADIINTQSRRLYDKEFQALKRHPEVGADMLDSDFDEYKDVIRGHHRFYNDCGGYPENLNTVDSPIRILINLVTICDCIDAATDHLGRNYSTGKTFPQVAEELRQGKGTRYNPELVDLLDEDPYLFSNLNDILTNQRGLIYYRLNQVFITKH